MNLKMYIVKYRMQKNAEVKEIWTLANNKIAAWNKVTFIDIPYKEKASAYSTWVDRVEYDNGKTKKFNTCEGIPY